MVDMAVDKEKEMLAAAGSQEMPLMDLNARFQSIDRLPSMPEMTKKIFSLSTDPDAGVVELVNVVVLDPSLCAQIMCYARSPFFNYRGDINSIDIAISRVLGYTTALNLALGATASKPFKIPKNIPLGLDHYWRSAVFNGALSQAISCALPAKSRPSAGLAYLAGLLHDFGFLLMGHLFKEEFLMLNRHVSSEPDRPIIELEQEVLGVGHAEIGAVLMERWALPDEVVVAIREHHHDYDGPHAVYSNIVQLSNWVLEQHDMGPEASGDIPEALLCALGLEQEQIMLVVEQVLGDGDALSQMAQKLAQ